MQVWSNSAGVYPSRQKKLLSMQSRNQYEASWGKDCEFSFHVRKKNINILPGWWCIAKEYETNVLIFSNTNSLIKILLWLWPYDKLSTETVKLTTKLKKVFQMNFKFLGQYSWNYRLQLYPLAPGMKPLIFYTLSWCRVWVYKALIQSIFCIWVRSTWQKIVRYS